MSVFISMKPMQKGTFREKYIAVKNQLTEKRLKRCKKNKRNFQLTAEETAYRNQIKTAAEQLEEQIEKGKLTKK